MKDTVDAELLSRNLPALKSREEMKNILLDNVYGRLPEIAYSCTVGEPTVVEGRMCGGKAVLSTAKMTISAERGSHSFPISELLHRDGEKHPFFVFMNFHSVPSLYYPVEEIAEAGFDVLSIRYTDVTSDDDDFTNGLAGILMPPHARESENGGAAAGKLALWAFAASRLLDYAGEIDCLDMSRAAVIGHSRLGKTALLAGMLDERFNFVFANDSGCGGDSLSKGSLGALGTTGRTGGHGESISQITKNFPQWFCPNFRKYADKNYSEIFDQHYLVASIAPRHVYVGSASADDWADPDSQFLSCAAASKAYEAAGLRGLVRGKSDDFPKVGDFFHDGMIGYHLRYGCHFLSRNDWQMYMKYMNAHKND